MATTTNYSWTTPDDTDLVKNGAAAIRTLGSAIDTSMNTALGTKKAGLVLLNTTSFSAVASQSLPADTFTSTYDNYMIYLEITARSTSLTVSLRFRASGVDKSGSNYGYVTRNYSDTGTDNVLTGSTQTSILVDHAASSNRQHFLTGFITNPKISKPTGIQIEGSSFTTVSGAQETSGMFYLTDSVDSLTVLASTGNITGLIRIYGVNQ